MVTPRTAAVALLVAIGIGAFEMVLYVGVLIAFPHLDAPGCAGPSAFCRPDGRPVPGGVYATLIGGNVLVLVALAALAIHVVRRRSSRLTSRSA